MKALKRNLLLATLAAVTFSGAALAAGTAVVPVTATVVGTCKFNTSGTVNFTLDPSVSGDVSGVVTQPQFWCTKGTSYTISDDRGLNESGTVPQMKHATLNEFIPYTLTYTSNGTGAGASNPVTMDIAATVVNSDFINASAGNYSDTVTLTVTP